MRATSCFFPGFPSILTDPPPAAVYTARFLLIHAIQLQHLQIFFPLLCSHRRLSSTSIYPSFPHYLILQVSLPLKSSHVDPSRQKPQFMPLGPLHNLLELTPMDPPRTSPIPVPPLEQIHQREAFEAIHVR